ncbi:dihydrolipoamide acetyltransferase family protein [Nocardia farcinica]|uniref:dihydrolipoamide acetyltransferase family protein n=1 Tax=Nocardia farcinica TaxID=37329 RepID=UPI0018941325|nr:dihydrolipoamide acetyltransferase family protein [Nocardia farcinica]MBF6271674.1 2-oxo acid dehydrogenase subunit E2 [Nocardia farcinica]MCZ9330321.1 dihydrolipoamide acetyltransferase family protein [Nocardia farcinica]
MPNIKTFHLPDLGEGLTEADLITWTVTVGDKVALNQIIAEVETAKASVELPSPYAGTVAALHANEGDTVEVGSAFIDIAVDVVDGAPATASAPDSAPEPDAPAERAPVLVGYGVASEGASRRRKRAAASAAAGMPTPPLTTTQAAPGRPLASPPVRFAAKQLGVDLADVTATGVRGQITRDDLNRFLTAVPESSEADTDITIRTRTQVTDSDEVRIPIKGVRKHTAAAMVSSAFTAPHVTEFIDVDVTPTIELLDQLKQHKHFSGVRITPLALVAKALLVALRSNPALNSFWDEDAQEIVIKRYVNLGIAAATPRGLMVPNIKNAHTLGLRDLATALSDLTATAKEGKTGPTDLADGTITITNVGVFGVDAGTPILNPGEAAILCFGSIRRRPWEYQGAIALRSITTLSLSFDHRLVDGEQGSKFLATLADLLSDPITLIALS